MAKYSKYNQPEMYFAFSMKGDGKRNMERFLNDLQRVMAEGSSGSIVIKSGGGEKTYGFDGDGADRILQIKTKEHRKS